MCIVPDSDFYVALREQRASIVTDQIESFTPTGLQMKSGEHVEADIIVTATGLNLLSFGGVRFYVDGQIAHVHQQVIYKGSMLSGMPNFAFVFGYTNNSWTLRADLVCAYVCRLLNYLSRHEYRQVTPRLKEAAMELQPFLDLSSGYTNARWIAFRSREARRPGVFIRITGAIR